jgi:methionine-rich copper-binding protein CopC
MNRLLLLCLIPALVWGSQVSAHAVLERAIPGAGSSVRESPPKLKLWFSERIEPAFSTVEVLSPTSQRVETGQAQPDSADLKLLLVTLPPLAPGRYRVNWRVISVDTHVAKGSFTFDISR